MHCLSGEDEMCITPRSKKRKLNETLLNDAQEVPMTADPFGDFGNLDIPDLLHTTYVTPDIDLLESQNSLYQARFEDITLLEENINLASGENLTFGDEFMHPMVDFFVDPNAHAISLPMKQSVLKPPEIASLASAFDLPMEPAQPRVTTDVDQDILKVENILEPFQINELSSLVLPVDLNQLSAQQIMENADQANLRPDNINPVHVCELATVLPVDLDRDPVQQTMDHQNLPSDHAQPEMIDVSVPLEPVVILEKLTLIEPVDQEPAPQYPLAKKSKLLVDSKIKLTTEELRWNMDHGDIHIMPMNSRAAKPSSRTTIHHLISESVPRLFAFPATSNLRMSKHLCEVWCRFRQLNVQDCPRSITERNEQLAPSPAAPPISARLTEDTVASAEQPRAGRTLSYSLPHSHSLLGSMHSLDMTLRATSSGLIEPGLKEGRPSQIVPLNAVEPLLLEQIEPAPVMDFTDRQFLTTTTTGLNPILEEEEEEEKKKLNKSPKGKDSQKLFDPPAIVQPTPTPIYTSFEQVTKSIIDRILSSNNSSIELNDLCPDGMTKRDAAKLFACILELKKRRLIQPIQLEPFGPICICKV